MLEYCSVSPMASRETHTVERTDSGERQDARLRGMSERRNQASHSVRTSSRAGTAAQRIRSSAGSLSSLSMSLSRSLTTHPVVVQRRPFGAIHDRSCEAGQRSHPQPS